MCVCVCGGGGYVCMCVSNTKGNLLYQRCKSNLSVMKHVSLISIERCLLKNRSIIHVFPNSPNAGLPHTNSMCEHTRSQVYA